MVIFTDGSWEGNFAGAVIIDVSTGLRLVCKCTVPEHLLEKWKVTLGDNLICQIELFVIVLIRWQFKDLFCRRRSIWWMDNDPARFCTIKGLSPSPSMRDGFTGSNDSWIDRVPGSSTFQTGRPGMTVAKH